MSFEKDGLHEGFLENWEDVEEHESVDCQSGTSLLFP